MKSYISKSLPIFEKIYRDIAKSPYLEDKSPNLNKLYVSDDPETDRDSIAHVTTRDVNNDGTVDSININIIRMKDILKNFLGNPSKVDKVNKFIKDVRDSNYEEKDDFMESIQDTIDYMNAIGNVVGILEHEKDHLKKQVDRLFNFNNRTMIFLLGLVLGIIITLIGFLIKEKLFKRYPNLDFVRKK